MPFTMSISRENSLAGEQVRDQPEQSALQDQPRAVMVSNREAALEVDLLSNNTPY